ncbi:MAG: hypothetical protein LBQ81_02835 [Zoogloeaceae bacterium]|jgi:hypothetical protein|nr:hypothetical protein [Zoogloeaceae bacterium]
MKQTLAWAAAAMLAAAGVIAALWGNAELRRAHAEARQAVTQLDELHAQLARLRDPEARQLAKRFASLQAQGFFAEPKARALATRLQAARENLDIAGLRHALKTPQPLADGLLRQNRMEIELELLHEQKFVDFWRALDWPLPLQLAYCDLERAAATLEARCQVHWLTAAPSGDAP